MFGQPYLMFSHLMNHTYTLKPCKAIKEHVATPLDMAISKLALTK